MNRECRVQLCERQALLSILRETTGIEVFRVSRSGRAKSAARGRGGILSGQAILARVLVLDAGKEIARGNPNLSFVVAFIVAVIFDY